MNSKSFLSLLFFEHQYFLIIKTNSIIQCIVLFSHILYVNVHEMYMLLYVNEHEIANK